MILLLQKVRTDTYTNTIGGRLGVALCVVAVALLTSCSRSPGYWRFTNRGQNYYAQLADGLDLVLAENHDGSGHIVKLSGEATNLPPVIRELNPTYMVVSTNWVLLVIGNGRASYKIGWAPGSSDRSLCRLTAGRGEGSPVEVLFSRRMLPKRDYPHPQI